jgi:hypothetical protein
MLETADVERQVPAYIPVGSYAVPTKLWRDKDVLNVVVFE